MLPTGLGEDFSPTLLPALSLFPLRGCSSPISMLHTTPSHELNQLMLQNRTHQQNFALSMYRLTLQRKNSLQVQSWRVFCVPDKSFHSPRKTKLSLQRNVDCNSKHYDQQPAYYSVEFHSITDLCGA